MYDDVGESHAARRSASVMPQRSPAGVDLQAGGPLRARYTVRVTSRPLRLRVLAALACVSPCAVPVAPDVEVAEVRAEEDTELVVLGYTDVPASPPEPLAPLADPAPVQRDPARTSRFAALCEAGCSTSPRARAATLPEPLALPADLAVRRLSIRVWPAYQQVEVYGELHRKDVELLAPAAPLTFQVYSINSVARCTLPADVSGRVSVGSVERQTVLEPGGVKCEEVAEAGYFTVGEVLPFPVPLVEEMLATAQSSMQPTAFASDRAVTLFLRNDPRYRLGPANVWRPSATSAAIDAKVVAPFDLPGVVMGPYGTNICELCEYDDRFVGPLRVEGTVALLGDRADEFCRKWDAPGDKTFALRIDDRLTATWPTVGPCPRSHPYQYDIARVPFDAEPLPPWIPQPGRAGPTSVPEAVTGSIALLGAWIAASELDPRKRAKAVHDWIALNVRYDGPAYVAKQYPPQDAEAVFRTRTAVCAGYSNLYVALARASGVEAVFLSGEAVIQGRLESHAWNAVRIDGNWELLDVTWDAGSLSGAVFTPSYDTDWLFTGPEVFVATHVADDPAWQLVPRPWTPEEALNRPLLGNGLVLVAPRTSNVVTSDDALSVRVEGFSRIRPEIAIRPRTGGPSAACDGSCELPSEGEYVVEITSRGEYAGQIGVRRVPPGRLP